MERVKERFIKLQEQTRAELEIHTHNLRYLDMVINFLSREFEVNRAEVEKSILLTYIKAGSIPRTKDEVNNTLGYRIKTTSKQGERKYGNPDISELINSEYQETMGEEYNEILQVAKILYWYSGQASYGNLRVADSKINEEWIK